MIHIHIEVRIDIEKGGKAVPEVIVSELKWYYNSIMHFVHFILIGNEIIF